MDQKKVSLETLRATGLLFEINRRVLHPLGLALVFSYDQDAKPGEEPQVSVMGTDDMEGFVFSPDSFKRGMEKLERFMKEAGSLRIGDREDILGFREQTSSDQGESTDA